MQGVKTEYSIGVESRTSAASVVPGEYTVVGGKQEGMEILGVQDITQQIEVQITGGGGKEGGGRAQQSVIG